MSSTFGGIAVPTFTTAFQRDSQRIMTDLVRQRDSGISIADGHSDLVVDILRRQEAGERAILLNHHVEPLRTAGVKVMMFSTGGDGPTQNIGSDDPFWCTMIRIRALLADLEESAERVTLCLTMKDVDRALAEEKLAALMMIEGAAPLKTSIEALDILYRWGIRSVQLTWNARNLVGDGCGESATGGGLTRFGKVLIRDMNRRQMLLDLSHASEALFYSVADTAGAPFIVSHANARAVCDHPRNLTDDQLRVLAEHHGVIGLCMFPWFIDSKRPSIERLADHLDHIVGVIGIEHITIGADFIYYAPEIFGRELSSRDKTGMYDKGFNLPQELRDLRSFALLETEMEKRGYSRADMAKVFSENLLRVYREVIG
jgi:membrane dipeptidase